MLILRCFKGQATGGHSWEGICIFLKVPSEGLHSKGMQNHAYKHPRLNIELIRR